MNQSSTQSALCNQANERYAIQATSYYAGRWQPIVAERTTVEDAIETEERLRFVTGFSFCIFRVA